MSGERCAMLIASAEQHCDTHVRLQSSQMADLFPPDPEYGVFETMLVVRGAPCELDGHLARLQASLRELYDLPLPAGVRALAHDQSSGVSLGRLRLSLTPSLGTAQAEAVVQPVERAIVLPGWECALDLRAVVVDGWRGAHKWADRRMLERLDAQAAPAGALLVDRERGVLETTRANVLAVGADGVLRTPPLDGGVLPGVARARVIALAREAGIAVRETPLSREDLADAREAFATGSVRGVEPIRSLDDVAIAGPGPTTALLARELRVRWLGAAVTA